MASPDGASRVDDYEVTLLDAVHILWTQGFQGDLGPRPRYPARKGSQLFALLASLPVDIKFKELDGREATIVASFDALHDSDLLQTQLKQQVMRARVFWELTME
jgi:hypothetical protein